MISPGQAIQSGLGFAPFAETAKAAETAPIPPAFEPTNKPESWTSVPSVESQRVIYPDSVRLDKTLADIFDLSNEDHFKKYNALIQRTDPIKGDVHVMVEECQFSDKTDNWKIFVQYRTYLFKQIAPKKES